MTNALQGWEGTGLEKIMRVRSTQRGQGCDNPIAFNKVDDVVRDELPGQPARVSSATSSPDARRRECGLQSVGVP